MNPSPEEKEKKYPKGYFLNLWMAIGIAAFSGIGIPVAVITHNFVFMGIGPAIGFSIGITIGQTQENKYAKEDRIRPLTENEKRKTRSMLVGSLIVFFVLFFAALILLIRLK